MCKYYTLKGIFRQGYQIAPAGNGGGTSMGTRNSRSLDSGRHGDLAQADEKQLLVVGGQLSVKAKGTKSPTRPTDGRMGHPFLVFCELELGAGHLRHENYGRFERFSFCRAPWRMVSTHTVSSRSSIS